VLKKSKVIGINTAKRLQKSKRSNISSYSLGWLVYKMGFTIAVCLAVVLIIAQGYNLKGMTREHDALIVARSFLYSPLFMNYDSILDRVYAGNVNESKFFFSDYFIELSHEEMLFAGDMKQNLKIDGAIYKNKLFDKSILMSEFSKIYFGLRDLSDNKKLDEKFTVAQASMFFFELKKLNDKDLNIKAYDEVNEIFANKPAEQFVYDIRKMSKDEFFYYLFEKGALKGFDFKEDLKNYITANEDEFKDYKQKKMPDFEGSFKIKEKINYIAMRFLLYSLDEDSKISLPVYYNEELYKEYLTYVRGGFKKGEGGYTEHHNVFIVTIGEMKKPGMLHVSIILPNA
jgi:hypothetical protein